MTVHELLHTHTAEIIAEAEEAVLRAHLHNYEKSGPEHTHQRLKALFVLTARAAKGTKSGSYDRTRRKYCP